MSAKLPGYDRTVVCPYNKCHIILKSRIQTHLVKCEKQHPEIKLETCPFDITHRFRPEEKALHMEECASRDNFDRYCYSADSNRGGSGGGGGGGSSSNGSSVSQSNQSQSTQATKYPKREVDEDDWSD